MNTLRQSWNKNRAKDKIGQLKEDYYRIRLTDGKIRPNKPKIVEQMKLGN